MPAAHVIGYLGNDKSTLNNVCDAVLTTVVIGSSPSSRDEGSTVAISPVNFSPPAGAREVLKSWWRQLAGGLVNVNHPVGSGAEPTEKVWGTKCPQSKGLTKLFYFVVMPA